MPDKSNYITLNVNIYFANHIIHFEHRLKIIEREAETEDPAGVALLIPNKKTCCIISV